MARATKAKKAATTTANIPKGYLRTRPTTAAEKIEYNVNKLSIKSAAVPKVPKAKKAPKKKGGKKIATPYLTLIKRALKKIGTKEHKSGVSVPAIVKYLVKNFPDKSDRRHVRLALAKGVEKKIFVKTRLRYRLSAKAEKPQKRKKTTSKKSGTKRKASSSEKKTKKTTKKAKTSKESTKKTTKKATTKKTTTSKKSASASKSTAKSATKPKKATAPKKAAAQTIRGTIAEGPEGSKGIWQYYDNGWHDYYTEASDVVEGIYQEWRQNPNSGLDVRAVKSGHFQYSVDFNALQQKNIETGTVRNIQRRLG